MLVTVDAITLFRSVIGDATVSDDVVRKHLAEAERLGVDPLDYCAHRFGLGNALVWQRAAQWAGFTFAAVAPLGASGCAPDRLTHLGEVRTLPRLVLAQELVFAAPRFAQVVNLRRSREERPELGKRLRFAPPDAIETGLAAAASAQLLEGARQNTTRLWPAASAAQNLPLMARVAFVAGLVLLIGLVMAAGFIARPVLVPVVAVLLMAPGMMRLLAALPREPATAPTPLADAELPVYSVLVPLRDEARMVPLLQRAMAALDYPGEKLDIKFVVEAKSPETVAAVEAILGDPRFRLVVVPEALPATKPKAIDYALPLARGKYVVVYDAEDVPEPDQLRLAASRFEADAGLACLQAELVPDNASENALTALFSGEYAGLFGRLLPALARWGMPVPLGGTSNHFRMDVLRGIGGWDAFNVTEDADLGVRLARRGLRAETLASRTYEEAPLTLKAWMGQRTRWMKGWMQTYVVHMSAPRQFRREIGWRGFAGFQVLVGGMIVSSLLHTVFVGSLLVRLLTEGVVGLVPHDVWDWFSVGILAAGYGGAFAVVASGLLHLRAPHLLAMQVLLPGYWFLHSVAACRAAVELISKPVHWEKTTHGVTRLTRRQGVTFEPVAVLRPRSG